MNSLFSSQVILCTGAGITVRVQTFIRLCTLYLTDVNFTTFDRLRFHWINYYYQRIYFEYDDAPWWAVMQTNQWFKMAWSFNRFYSQWTNWFEAMKSIFINLRKFKPSLPFIDPSTSEMSLRFFPASLHKFISIHSYWIWNNEPFYFSARRPMKNVYKIVGVFIGLTVTFDWHFILGENEEFLFGHFAFFTKPFANFNHFPFTMKWHIII